MFMNTRKVSGQAQEIAVSKGNIFSEGVRLLTVRINESDMLPSKIAFYNVSENTFYTTDKIQNLTGETNFLKWVDSLPFAENAEVIHLELYAFIEKLEASF